MMSCKTLEQLEENMGALTFRLSVEDVRFTHVCYTKINFIFYSFKDNGIG
jgi:aryl-alcohol dehydrogenase-like predicted oxidoreductase